MKRPSYDGEAAVWAAAEDGGERPGGVELACGERGGSVFEGRLGRMRVRQREAAAGAMVALGGPSRARRLVCPRLPLVPCCLRAAAAASGLHAAGCSGDPHFAVRLWLRGFGAPRRAREDEREEVEAKDEGAGPVDSDVRGTVAEPLVLAYEERRVPVGEGLQDRQQRHPRVPSGVRLAAATVYCQRLEELEIGAVIGHGAGGVVNRAVHKPTGMVAVNRWMC